MSGAQNRIDFSGVRGGLKRPLMKRDAVYPYDKQTNYGSAAFDKSLTQGKDANDHPLVPKHIEHTHWEEDEDEIQEASGTPINFGKSGSASTGAVVPGSAKGWASWSDDQEIDDEELSKAAKSYQNMMPAGRNQFMGGIQKRNMNGRENKMNTWNMIAEAFVSLKNTPEGTMTVGQGIEEAELESVMQEFDEESAHVQAYLDEVDEAEGIRFMFRLDPDHASKSLAHIGKDKIKGMYNSWADRTVQGQPHDDALADVDMPEQMPGDDVSED